jgi:hypothetical protein
VVLCATLPVLGAGQGYALAWLTALLSAQVGYAMHARPVTVA